MNNGIAVLLACVLVLGSELTTSRPRVVRLTDLSGAVEASVAINPTNPDNIVVVSMAKPPGGTPRVTNYAYVTTDGGHTWKTVANPNPELRVQGDDAITFNSEGVAYRSYISFDGLYVQRPARALNGIFVGASSDGGLTWKEPVTVVDHKNTVSPFEDKPYLVVDNAPTSPHKHNVYIAWTRFDVYGSADPEHKSHIYFSRSTDGGKTFAVPIRISDTGGDCLDSDNTVEGAVPAVGPNGEVYVVWSGPLGLVFDKSLDGGLTFGKDTTIGPHPGGWDISIAGINRHNGMPVTGVDHSGGPYRGSLYVNWIDQRHGDPDVFIMYSRDGGATWSKPVRVNDDPIGNRKEQFFTWMAVDPADGSINVIFYDRRDTTDTLTRLTLARSIDGGQTFVNHPINQPAFSCNPNIFFGDYTGIAARNGLVVPVFMHFVNATEVTLSAALFRFKPGTQQLIN